MLKDRFILLAITISIIALQVALWPIILKLADLPDEVAFWYTLPPAGRLAPANYLWFIPGIAATSLMINLVLGFFLYRKHPSTSQTLAAVAALVSILAAIAIVKTFLIYTTLL